jgi:hypothetical protein
LTFDVGSGPDACAVPSGTFYYSPSVLLGVSSELYSDSGGTTPASDGYYADGVNYFYVTSGVIGSSGSC